MKNVPSGEYSVIMDIMLNSNEIKVTQVLSHTAHKPELPPFVRLLRLIYP